MTLSPPRRFILFAMPRTGSTMVVNWLSEHPRIACHASILSPNEWLGAPGSREAAFRLSVEQQFEDETFRTENWLGVVDRLVAHYPEKAWVGFKHMLGGPGRSVSDVLIADPQFRRIVLRRDNVLASFASHKVVEQRKLSQVPPGAIARGEAMPDGEPAKPRFSAEEFVRFSRRREKAYAIRKGLFEVAGSDLMQVEYNEVRTRPGMQRIVTFLGEDPDLLGAATTAKRGDDDIVTRFDNPDDALAHLRAIGREEWVREVAA